MLSCVEVGRPLLTDMPPVVSVIRPFWLPQPLLGTGAPLPPMPPPPPLPELPPADVPPAPALPPTGAPPLPPLPESPAAPAAVPPLPAPPEVMPPPPAPPLGLPAAALPPAVDPLVDEPAAELPPALLPAPPAPPGSSGVVLPQPTPNDKPTINAGSNFVCMRFSREAMRLGTFLLRRFTESTYALGASGYHNPPRPARPLHAVSSPSAGRFPERRVARGLTP